LGLQGRRSRLNLGGYRASPTGDRVAGRLAYPAPLHGLRAVSGACLRGISVTSAARGRSLGRQPSWPLPLLQSARGNAGTASRWFLLSWDFGPCRRCTCLSSTPGAGSEEPAPSYPRRQAQVMFRPRGFAPPRRFAPSGSCGSVAPRYRPRVHRVSCVPAKRSPEGGQVPGTVLAVRFGPFEEFPSSAAGSASLRPLPSCRCRPARRAGR
jgi:hypothetical protein